MSAYCVCPHEISVASFPGLPRFNFRRSSDSMYYCEHKREIKTGEAWDRGYNIYTVGNLWASLHLSLACFVVLQYHMRINTSPLPLHFCQGKGRAWEWACVCEHKSGSHCPLNTESLTNDLLLLSYPSLSSSLHLSLACSVVFSRL